MVDVRVDTEEAGEDLLDNLLEVLREGRPWKQKQNTSRRATDTLRGRTELQREDVLVVKLLLNPAHEEIHVLRRADFDRLLHLHAIRPVVFIPVK